MSLNKVMLIGNVGRDPDVTRFDSGNIVAKFSLATSEKYKDETKTEWHNIIIWGRLAEIVEKYIRKGSTLYLEGKIQQDEYKDKEGNKKYTTNIVCHSMQMLGGKENRNEPRISSTDLNDDDFPFK